MATIHGVAGEWARVKGTVVGLWPIFVGSMALGFGIATWIFRSSALGAALSVLAVAGVVYSYLIGIRRVGSFFKGARGEERVASILANLPASYHVFNDFTVGRDHVDHVVVGPAGVFAIETKFWLGKVTLEDGHVLVDGHVPSRAPLAQVQREARIVGGALAKKGWDGTVTPVVAFASNTFQAQVAEAGGAVIMNARELGRCLTEGREVIPAAELQRLIALMLSA